MRDLFISPRNRLLTNWTNGFADAEVYTDLASVRLSKKEPCFFWLHADSNNQQWIVASISTILRDYYDPKIVVLANVPNQADAILALGQGALGYCHAYSEAEVLAEVKTVVMHGGLWLGRDLLHNLISVSKTLIGNSSRQVAATLALLTERERQVSLEAAKGASNKQIAASLNITERTVKAHLSASFERLGIKDRLQLVLLLNEKSPFK